jgi:protein NUD1
MNFIIARFLPFHFTELSCLRHLRELRVDGNQIASIEGLENMESLVKLSLRCNALRVVDLNGYRW